MDHEEIAEEILEDYGFDIVVLVTVDKNQRLKISAADTCRAQNRLTVSMLRRVVETIKDLVGWRGSNETIH